MLRNGPRGSRKYANFCVTLSRDAPLYEQSETLKTREERVQLTIHAVHPQLPPRRRETPLAVVRMGPRVHSRGQCVEIGAHVAHVGRRPGRSTQVVHTEVGGRGRW